MTGPPRPLLRLLSAMIGTLLGVAHNVTAPLAAVLLAVAVVALAVVAALPWR